MDFAKQTVINSLRDKIAELHNLCTRAEADDDMTSAEFLSHMADALTQPTVRILATLYIFAKDTQGEQSAKEMLDSYVQHLAESVSGSVDYATALMASSGLASNAARCGADGQQGSGAPSSAT